MAIRKDAIQDPRKDSATAIAVAAGYLNRTDLVDRMLVSPSLTREVFNIAARTATGYRIETLRQHYDKLRSGFTLEPRGH